MTYLIVSIANERGSPENAYAKLQKAAACQEAKFAGKCSIARCNIYEFTSVKGEIDTLMWNVTN